MSSFSGRDLHWERRADDHERNWRGWTDGMQVESILEVGSFEGRSALLWLRICPDATITCVDPFGGTEHGEDYEALFDKNTRGKPVEKVRAPAEYGLVRLISRLLQHHLFDVAYIDGDHTAGAAMRDAVLAWTLLRPGGLLIWDDYEWTTGGSPERCPRMGVDMFLATYANELDVLEPADGDTWQKAVRKR